MKNSDFRLQKLLKLRRIHERILKDVVAKLNQQRQELEESKRQLQLSRREAMKQGLVERRQATGLEAMEIRSAYLRNLRQQLESCQRDLDEVAFRLKDTHDRLRKARQETRLLEKLEEKHKSKLEAALDQKEQESLDEVANRLPVVPGVAA